MAGVKKEQIKELAELAKTKKFGLLFFGMGVTQTTGKHRNIDIAISWVADMNKYTKFNLIPMRGHYNVRLQPGHDLAVWIPVRHGLLQGLSEVNPGETTPNDILQRTNAMLLRHLFPQAHASRYLIHEVVRSDPDDRHRPPLHANDRHI